MQPVAANDVEAADLASLRADFPHFRIWREAIGGRVRYNAYRMQSGLHPHTLISDDLSEMRAALEPSRPEA